MSQDLRVTLAHGRIDVGFTMMDVLGHMIIWTVISIITLGKAIDNIKSVRSRKVRRAWKAAAPSANFGPVFPHFIMGNTPPACWKCPNERNG
jgi:hypothetical protein